MRSRASDAKTNKEKEQQIGIRKPSGDDYVDKRRGPQKSPAASLSIKRALQTPPSPRQPRKRAERAEPIGRSPTNDPAIQCGDQRDEDRQRERKFPLAREQKRAKCENKEMRDRKCGGLL